ncbi:type IV secretion system protein VirB3 [Klebsiella pneumoniae]|uniref:type IV secretion system protein VirB3 n=1 Tax=Klebsiella pneumoniae TaxID=573 RepID=UPI0021659037|nr:VirB3 family type IV secretion system protein [Klebsiella pneumoniae]
MDASRNPSQLYSSYRNLADWYWFCIISGFPDGRRKLNNAKRALFKGATRLPRALGVPRNVAMMIFMISASLFMIIHMWAILVFVFLWIPSAALTKYDDRMFRIMGLWLKTKFSNWFDSPFKQWGGSSYSSVDYKRKGLK